MDAISHSLYQINQDVNEVLWATTKEGIVNTTSKCPNLAIAWRSGWIIYLNVSLSHKVSLGRHPSKMVNHFVSSCLLWKSVYSILTFILNDRNKLRVALCCERLIIQYIQWQKEYCPHIQYTTSQSNYDIIRQSLHIARVEKRLSPFHHSRGVQQ